MPRHPINRAHRSRARVGRPGVINQADPHRQTKKLLRNFCQNLVDDTVVGPPQFPIRRSVGEALFGLAITHLAKHDQTTADALRRYSGQYARLDEFLLAGATFRKSPIESVVARVEFLLTEPDLGLINELQKNFKKFRKQFGRQTCAPKTITRQDELLRDYCRDHQYPAGSPAKRNERYNWAKAHLPVMIATAKAVTCWHPSPDFTKQKLEEIAGGIDAKTSASSLRALVLGHLHMVSPNYIAKRLLPRRHP